MSIDLTPHLDALEAELQLALVRIGQMRQFIAAQKPPVRVETPTLPERCADVAPVLCALRDEEARLTRASFGNPNGWQCVGCRYEGPTVKT